MEAGEQELAVGGVMYRKAGCRFIPLIPLKSAAALRITNRRIYFEPVIFYQFVIKKFSIELSDINMAEATGASMEMNLMDFVSIGKALTIRLKSGKSLVFRSTGADELAAAINQAVSLYGR